MTLMPLNLNLSPSRHANSNNKRRKMRAAVNPLLLALLTAMHLRKILAEVGILASNKARALRPRQPLHPTRNDTIFSTTKVMRNRTSLPSTKDPIWSNISMRETNMEVQTLGAAPATAMDTVAAVLAAEAVMTIATVEVEVMIAMAEAVLMIVMVVAVLTTAMAVAMIAMVEEVIVLAATRVLALVMIAMARLLAVAMAVAILLQIAMEALIDLRREALMKVRVLGMIGALTTVHRLAAMTVRKTDMVKTDLAKTDMEAVATKIAMAEVLRSRIAMANNKTDMEATHHRSNSKIAMAAVAEAVAMEMTGEVVRAKRLNSSLLPARVLPQRTL